MGPRGRRGKGARIQARGEKIKKQWQLKHAKRKKISVDRRE